MPQVLVLLLMLIAPLARAGERLDTVAGLSVGSLEATHENGTTYRFPLVRGESLAASRINTYLQTIELEKLPGRYTESAFEDVWPARGSPNGLVELDYSVASSQPGILSVDISGVYYGAYESAWGGRYFFDARTGEVITLRSLLSAAGRAKLDDEIRQARLRRVDDFLAGKPLPDDIQLRSDPGEAEEQRELYRSCRSQIENSHPVDADRLGLERDSLSLLREPCGPRAMLALDELDFRDTRGYAQIAELMNDYGRCLLIARETGCQRSAAEIGPGVYFGRIGDRYPITLVVEGGSLGGRVRARYYYDKYGIPIALNGTATDDGVVRLDERGAPPARFDLRLQPDGALVGEWTQEGKAPKKIELR